jgi:hypothetical protein
MDSGPKYMRRIFTATPTQFNISMTLTSAEVDTLLVFYQTTAKQGTVPFEWKHPRTQATVDMRFLGDQPSYGHAGAEEFQTSFTVEVLP